jgi:hypothetical protein
MDRKLYVWNLPFQTGNASVREHPLRAGRVDSAA